MVELKKTAALLADGNYGIRLPVRGKDEIAELTESFNQMAEKIEEHVEKLSTVNETQRQLLGSLAHELKNAHDSHHRLCGYALDAALKRTAAGTGPSIYWGRVPAAFTVVGEDAGITGLYEMGESTMRKKRWRYCLSRKSEGAYVLEIAGEKAFPGDFLHSRGSYEDHGPGSDDELVMNLVDNA